MGFVSLSGIAEQKRGVRGGSRKPRDANALVFRTYVAKDGRASIVFSIYSALLKKARLIKGDRVDIGVDATDRTGLIKRVKDGGYMLTPRGGSKDSNDTLDVKMTWYDGMPSIADTAVLENVAVSEEGILFTFPSATSFNGLKVNPKK